MSTLEIQNIPQELYDLLKKSAGRFGRSLAQEVIILLEKILTEKEEFILRKRIWTESTNIRKLTKEEGDLAIKWIRKDRER